MGTAEAVPFQNCALCRHSRVKVNDMDYFIALDLDFRYLSKGISK